MIERIPPQNVDAELSVLGAAVTNKEAAIKATDVLQAADFYREANAVVFEAINNLIFHNQNVDVLTVTEELRRMGQLDNVGGVSYVTDLPNHLVSSLDVERHAQIENMSDSRLCRGLIMTLRHEVRRLRHPS